MWVSAVAAGEQVGLRLRVYGEKGHIAWEQSDPDKLKFAVQGEASRTILRGQSGLSPAAKRATRIVAGLPEGYFEAFATLYRDYADILAARRAGETPDPLALWAPMVEDGARGIAFVEAALSSNSEGGRWLEFQPPLAE
jgi:predicted dehydrogenase